MNKLLVQALEDGLRALQAGETLDAVLRRYPHLAGELRPLLVTAQAAESAGRSPVPAAAQARGRSRVLAAAGAMRPRTVRRAGNRLWRVALAALAVVVFLAISGTGLLTASAESLPGDTLYPLKRLVEDVRLQFAADPDQELALEEEFYQRRVEETESLLVAGRVETVEFDGHVEAQTPDGWIVEGIPVVVDSQTTLIGTVTIGAEVEVRGQTGPGESVRALTITVKGEGDGQPEEEEGGDSSQEEHGPRRSETSEAERTDSRRDDATEAPESTESYEGSDGETLEATDSSNGGEATPEPPSDSTDDHSGDDD